LPLSKALLPFPGEASFVFSPKKAISTRLIADRPSRVAQKKKRVKKKAIRPSYAPDPGIKIQKSISHLMTDFKDKNLFPGSARP